MRFSSFTYLVGQGLHNLKANRLMTLASMGVLTVCMLLIGAAFLLYIVPLAVLLIGYLLIAQTGAPESTCIAGAFAAFAVAVAVVTIYQRQRTKKKQIEFEIIAYNLND